MKTFTKAKAIPEPRVAPHPGNDVTQVLLYGLLQDRSAGQGHDRSSWSQQRPGPPHQPASPPASPPRSPPPRLAAPARRTTAPGSRHAPTTRTIHTSRTTGLSVGLELIGALWR
jgi:hypothetical protein